jgi:hypothetical protein
MIRRTHPINNTHNQRIALFCGVFLAGVALFASPTEAAKKTTKKTKTTKVTVANGKACKAAGTPATAGGRSFTCVRMKNDSLQWWAVGTIQNPIRLGSSGRVESAGSGAWEVTVVRRIDDDTARILAIEATNRVEVEGNTIASLEIRARSLGPAAETSIRATAFEVTTATRERVERWDLGQGAPEDCWRDERVANGSEKTCQFPFEITPGTELAGLRMAVRPSFGLDAPLYFDTALDQPPLR